MGNPITIHVKMQSLILYKKDNCNGVIDVEIQECQAHEEYLTSDIYIKSRIL